MASVVKYLRGIFFGVNKKYLPKIEFNSPNKENN